MKIIRQLFLLFFLSICAIVRPAGIGPESTFTQAAKTNTTVEGWNQKVSEGIGPVNVKWSRYGAVGNGTADDTAKIQAAIDAVGSGTVYIPKGTYKITSALIVTNTGVTIQGDGPRQTILTNSNTAGDAIWFTDSTGIDQIRFPTIKDLSIWGPGKSSGTASAIVFNRATYGNVENVDIINFPKYGIYFTNIHNTSFACTIKGGQIGGIGLAGIYNGQGSCNTLNIGPSVELNGVSSAGYGIQTAGSNGKIFSSVIEGFTNAAIVLDGRLNSSGTNVTTIAQSIESNYGEGNGVNILLRQDATFGSGVIQGVDIKNNFWQADTNIAWPGCFIYNDGVSISGLHVSGNWLEAVGGAAAYPTYWIDNHLAPDIYTANIQIYPLDGNTDDETRYYWGPDKPVVFQSVGSTQFRFGDVYGQAPYVDAFKVSNIGPYASAYNLPGTNSIAVDPATWITYILNRGTNVGASFGIGYMKTPYLLVDTTANIGGYVIADNAQIYKEMSVSNAFVANILTASNFQAYGNATINNALVVMNTITSKAAITATNFILSSPYNWIDSMVPAAGLRNGATAPAFAALTSTNSQYVLKFSTGDDAHGSIQLNHGYVEGSPIHMHVHYVADTTPSPASATNVVWGLDYSWASINGYLIAHGTLTVTNGVVDKGVHRLAEWEPLTNNTAGISSIILFRIYRVAAGDTYSAGEPGLLGIGAHYQVSGIGSSLETSK